MGDVETELPKTIIKRIVKGQLDKLSGQGDDKKNYQLNSDALLAFSESAKIFISYLTATANDICQERKRQTISADDIFAALKDIEFQQFVEPLKEALEAHREEGKEKRAQAQKRKQESAEGGAQKDADGGDADEGDAEDEEEPPSKQPRGGDDEDEEVEEQEEGEEED